MNMPMKDPYHIWKASIAVTRWIGSPISLVVHTALFIASFYAVHLNLIVFSEMLLILTTIVSLEAIYLAIFIQMTINYTTQELAEVSEDIDEIQQDIDEIQEDMGELQEDVEEISEEDEIDEAERARREEQKRTLGDIQTDLRRLAHDITLLQKQQTTQTEERGAARKRAAKKKTSA